LPVAAVLVTCIHSHAYICKEKRILQYDKKEKIEEKKFFPISFRSPKVKAGSKFGLRYVLVIKNYNKEIHIDESHELMGYRISKKYLN